MKKILLLLFILLADDAASQWPMPVVLLPQMLSANPGDTLDVPVKIINTSTVNLWGARIFIDMERMDSQEANRIRLEKGEDVVGQKIEPDAEIEASLEIRIASDAEPSALTIPISLTGRYGKCQGGCKPFFVKGETNVNIKSAKPALRILAAEKVFEARGGDDVSIMVVLENFGDGEARDVMFFADIESPILVRNNNEFSIIGIGGREEATIEISIPKDASPGMYALTLSASWKDALEYTYDWKRELKINVGDGEKKQEDVETPMPTTINESQKGMPATRYLLFYSSAGLLSFAASFLLAKRKRNVF